MKMLRRISLIFIMLSITIGLVSCSNTNRVMEQAFKIQNNTFEFIKEGNYSHEDIKEITLSKDANGIKQNIKIKEINISQTFNYKELSLQGDIIAPINASENDIVNCINLVKDWDGRNSNNELYINAIKEAEKNVEQKITLNQNDKEIEFYIQVLNNTLYIHII
ncbi:hypothetical protein FDB37_15745 [Clostridium botulinum]|uniref:hypothetical protein n=1 Tax=Clostridium botulinum TaxID=1491 RepID=UPI0013F06D37|nr:hypothetical protein [Clostridium botulinum]MBN1050337.1 hypothetical protein [Clostridium botulinum]NFO35019.1 hypothetical protein [Clostridium botulinum]